MVCLENKERAATTTAATVQNGGCCAQQQLGRHRPRHDKHNRGVRAHQGGVQLPAGAERQPQDGVREDHTGEDRNAATLCKEP